MFETAEMSRLTVASPVDKMEEVLRICADLGCVHIEEYGNFEDGIGVGKSISSDNSAMVINYSQSPEPYNQRSMPLTQMVLNP